MKIGLVGESPNDTQSIISLLKKKYSNNCQYFSLINHIRGSQLDHQKTKKLLRKEFELEKPDLVIFIRDLDGLQNDKHQLNIRKKYFSEQNKLVNQTGLFLLNIYEIEALLLCDLDMLNSVYGTSIKLDKKPIEIEQPKEYLREEILGYTEYHNKSLFEKLDFNKALEHPKFKEFIHEFSKKIIHEV
jgi:hypothetical protein